MNPGNLVGVISHIHNKPQLASAGAKNLWNRFKHSYSTTEDKSWSTPPEQITIVVTDICNLRCKMCQYAFSDAPGYQLNQVGKMSPHLFRKVMDEVPGKPIITFTGGEPLLHPKIADFIQYTKEKGRFSTLTTNGWMLAKRAEALCNAGLDVLIVSVDGTEEVHNKIRGGKSYQRLADGVQTILKQPKRPLVFINSVITEMNYDKLEPIYEQAKDWGVDGINYNHMWMQTGKMVDAFHALIGIFDADEVAWDLKPETIDVEILADSLERIRHRNRWDPFILSELPTLKRQDIATWYQNPTQFVKYTSTRCAWTRMKIWPDGNVKPCREWSAGNASQENPMGIWNGQKFRDFRHLLNKHKTIPLCSRCCYMTHR